LFFIRSVYKIFRFNLKNPVAAFAFAARGRLYRFRIKSGYEILCLSVETNWLTGLPPDPFPLFQKILTSTAFMGVGHKIHETPSPV